MVQLTALRNEGKRPTRIEKIGVNMQSLKKRGNMQLKLETRAVMQITHVEMCAIIAVQYIWNRKSCLWDPSWKSCLWEPSYSVEYKTLA